MKIHPSRTQDSPALRRAFSLLEILIAVTVAAILFAVCLPVLRNSISVAASTRCLGNLKELGNAALLYRTDHNGWTLPAFGSPPPPDGWTTLSTAWYSALKARGYMDAPTMAKLHCSANPLSPIPGTAVNGGKGLNYSQAYGSWNTMRQSDSFPAFMITNPSARAMFSDGFVRAGAVVDYTIMSDDLVGLPQTPEIYFHQKGVNVLFFDNSARRIPMGEMDRLWWTFAYQQK